MIRIEIQYLNTDKDDELDVAIINARHVNMVRICSKEHERDIYLDTEQFMAAFMQKKPEKLFMYYISPKDVGKMITVAKG